MSVTIYCDGASRKDGRGGWGAHILIGVSPAVDICGGEYDTTNNRMELMAAIEALWFIPPRQTVTVISDSQYVVDGITDSIQLWKIYGWRTAANKPLKNLDLWQELEAAVAAHKSVKWEWVKGHSGVPGNERADELATLGVPEKRGEV